MALRKNKVNDPKKMAQSLCDSGAVFHDIALGVVVLVGYWNWLDDHLIFYFEAGARDEFGGHVFTFDRAVSYYGLGVEFWEGDLLKAYLSPIPDAVTDVQSCEKIWNQWRKDLSGLLQFIRETEEQLTA